MYLTDIKKEESETNSIFWSVKEIELVEISKEEAVKRLGNYSIYYLTQNNTIDIATWWSPFEVEFIIDGKKYYYNKYHHLPEATNYYMDKKTYERLKGVKY
jgi:hypothetical protein